MNREEGVELQSEGRSPDDGGVDGLVSQGGVVGVFISTSLGLWVAIVSKSDVGIEAEMGEEIGRRWVGN